MGRVERTTVDIRRLRYFLAVCDHGGFSRAAAAIGIAQPALTRQVQLLEHQLGLPLVRRTGRGAQPTEPGRALLAGARGHLEGLDALCETLRREFASPPEPLRVGICPTIMPLFRASLETFFRRIEPARELTIVEAYSGDLGRLLAGGHIHAALTYRPVDCTGDGSADLLSERLVLVARAGSATSEPVRLESVAGMRLILPSRIHQLRRIVDHVAAMRGVDLRPELELDSLDAVKAALDDPRCDYVTILPTNGVVADERAGRFALRPIDDPAMVRTIAVMVPPEFARDLPPDLLPHVWARADALKRELASVF